ncbi:M14 family metallopeptidase [Aquisalimonas asiatica]|uniref:Zinc carboxypeptidase n=1 Tax=Aquisalimonas asiatica TaxID=406100 RepID=A0A1H8TY65_9GAMM|nr:M14 family metallopeptidase [Aquisalimonas asiatica]SEO95837.1 Zinc carboxypeptidase [Aquisalimonas asiatica]
MAAIDSVNQGFRHRYLRFAELTSQLRAWADTYPDITRLHSLGTSAEGRDIWLLEISRNPGTQRPAAWVDGNMHGTEVAASSVALAIAEAVLRIHVEPRAAAAELPAPLLETLRDIQLYVLPRLSPDGAEAVLERGGFVRSVPRRHDTTGHAPWWQPRDMSGDGRCRCMRIPDAAGDFVAAEGLPGLMLPRQIDDPPPWFRLYPEGEIIDFDGETVPDADPLANTADLNRNFPWDWRPEPQQTGAGAFPGSEPETAAVMGFAADHPNIFAWLNLHTFGGVFIRPLGTQGDAHMHPGDRRLYRQLADWAATFTGYPTVSGYEQFTYEPEQPLRGDLVDFAYHQRGCLAVACELWDLFRRLDMPTPARFVDHYTALDRNDLQRLADWDRDHNHGRIFTDWTPVEHPQLGAVEVGGADPVVGIWNPPPESLPALCESVASYWLRVAALLPRLVIEEVVVSNVDEQLFEVSVTMANHGYLSTAGIPSSAALPWNHGVLAELVPHGCRLAAPADARRELGHLEGWGIGAGAMRHMPWFQRSGGSGHRRTLRWLVHGEGTLTLSVGNARLGWLQRVINAR